MKTKDLFFAACLLFTVIKSSSQCGVGYMPPKDYPIKILTNSRIASANLNFRLISVQDENGLNGVTDLMEIEMAITDAFKDVANFNFCRVFPKDPAFLSCPDNQNNVYGHQNAINLVVVPSNPCSNVRGFAIDNIGWASIEFGYGSVIHEIGHMFGLAHTFQRRALPDGNGGVLNDSNGNPILISEQVTRDATNTDFYEIPNGLGLGPFPCYNCELEGDRICDTPAQDFSSCDIWTSVLDRCGNPHIDEFEGEIDIIRHNYMRYSFEDETDCRNSFTSGQVAHMITHIANYHSDKEVGSEEPFTASVIDGPGFYVLGSVFPGSSSSKGVILEDLVLTEDTQIWGGLESIGVGPGVKISVENDANLILYGSIDLYDGPYPLCYDGPMSGDSWIGIEANTGGSLFCFLTCTEAVSPIVCDDCDRMIIAGTYEGYSTNAVKADGALGEIAITSATFTANDFYREPHIDVRNSNRFHFTRSNINGSMDDIGIYLEDNTTCVLSDLYGTANSINSCKQGVYNKGGSISISRTNFTNCPDFAILIEEANSAHIKNLEVMNCSGNNTRYEAINVDETVAYEIRNNEFTDCEFGAVGTSANSSEVNSIMNNKMEGNATKWMLAEGVQDQLRYFCNDFIGLSNANMALSGMIALDQGLREGVDLLSATNLFLNDIQNDIVGNGDRMSKYYHRSLDEETPSRMNFDELNVPVDLHIDDCASGVEMFAGNDPTVGLEDASNPNPEDLDIGGPSSLPNNDGDGQPDPIDYDDDNDGDPDETDPDDDNDDVPDFLDPDWCPPGMICGDPNSDPVIKTWEEIQEEKEIDCSEMFSDILSTLDQGDKTLSSDILNMEYSDRVIILQRIANLSSKLSPQTIKAMLNRAEYFYESEVELAIVSNPHVLFDTMLRAFVFQSGVLSESFLKSLRLNIESDSDISSSYGSYNECFIKKVILLRKLQNRYILYGSEYQGNLLAKRSRDVEMMLPLEVSFLNNNDNTNVLYPIPTTGNLSFTKAISDKSSVEITSTSGKVVFKSLVEPGESLDVSDLEPGIYYAKVVELSNFRIYSQKIILIR